jgi:hypothetical protein
MTLHEMRRIYDPDDLARTLARVFAEAPPTGFIIGRTSVRNVVVEVLGCSQLDADEIVDTLILRGKLVFVKSPDKVGSWAFRVPRPN